MSELARIRNGFCFGSFILDGDTGELYRHQELFKRLRPQEHKVLAALLDRCPAVIRRQELVTLLWGQGQEPDGGLKKVIAWLREDLGDSSYDPKFIEVLPRVGVRFVARVEKWERAAGTETPTREAHQIAGSPSFPSGRNTSATSWGDPKEHRTALEAQNAKHIEVSRGDQPYRVGWVHGFYATDTFGGGRSVGDSENPLYAVGYRDGSSFRDRAARSSSGQDGTSEVSPRLNAGYTTCYECGGAARLDDKDHRAYHCSNCGAYKQWSD